MKPTPRVGHLGRRKLHAFGSCLDPLKGKIGRVGRNKKKLHKFPNGRPTATPTHTVKKKTTEPSLGSCFTNLQIHPNSLCLNVLKKLGHLLFHLLFKKYPPFGAVSFISKNPDPLKLLMVHETNGHQVDQVHR